MLEAYREHVAERAAQNIPPKPLSAEQVAGLVELLKNPPAGEEEYLVDLISNRVPPGVDEAAFEILIDQPRHALSGTSFLPMVLLRVTQRLPARSNCGP